MNEEEVKALYETLAEGMTKLYQQSEAAGDDVSLNPARTHLLALSGYLLEQGILEALTVYADYLHNHDEYPAFVAEPLKVV